MRGLAPAGAADFLRQVENGVGSPAVAHPPARQLAAGVPPTPPLLLAGRSRPPRPARELVTKRG